MDDTRDEAGRRACGTPAVSPVRASPHPCASAPLVQPLRIALVTETFPPEINGVAMTIGRLLDGLLARGHSVQLARPRQRPGEVPRSGAQLEELLLASVPLPRYQGLRMGLPARRALHRAWQR